MDDDDGGGSGDREGDGDDGRGGDGDVAAKRGWGGGDDEGTNGHPYEGPLAGSRHAIEHFIPTLHLPNSSCLVCFIDKLG